MKHRISSPVSALLYSFLTVSVLSLAQKLILCRVRHRIIMQKTAADDKSLNIFISCYYCDIQWVISWVWHHTTESGTRVYVQILQKSCPTPPFLPRNWKLFHNISKSCTANILQELHQPVRKSHSKLALLSSTTFKRAFLLIKAIRHEICHSVSFSNQVPSFLFDSRERN